MIELHKMEGEWVKLWKNKSFIKKLTNIQIQMLISQLFALKIKELDNIIIIIIIYDKSINIKKKIIGKKFVS